MDSNWVSIIGTLGGVVIGTAGTTIVQRLGKLRVNIKSATLSFSGLKPLYESFGKLSLSTRPETGWFNLEVLMIISRSRYRQFTNSIPAILLVDTGNCE